MSGKHQIVIDLDLVAADSDALSKLYESASLMVQSADPRESELGYRLLDMVRDVMDQPDTPLPPLPSADSGT